MHLDACWYVTRCEHCRGTSVRGVVEAPSRHLPRPGVAGEVIGVDLKTVVPPGQDKWVLLLAVDFATNKIWTFDLDFGPSTVEEVQPRLLKLFADTELPAIVHSDNGSQFRSTISLALERAVGLKPRYIPPGRPQANGLVETFNKVLDHAMGGQRSRLLSATVAHNQTPNRKFGVSPECLWRVLRPTDSRWRALGLNLLHSEHAQPTEEDWSKYLDMDQNLDAEWYKGMSDKFHKRIGPEQEAIANVHVRSQMAKDLGFKRQRTGYSPEYALIAGDHCIVLNSQYGSKTDAGKFLCSADGTPRHFVVVSVAGQVARIRDLVTGDHMLKHLESLKIMPKAIEASSAIHDAPQKRFRSKGPVQLG